jgi:sigma-E factor negative regulatory protein RseC
MLTEQGKVVALEPGSVWVETLRQSSCGSCNARAGCGHGMLNSALPGSSRAVVKALLPADRLLRLELHDIVEIALPENGFLRAASLLYVMPLLTTVGCALLADRFWVMDSSVQAAADLTVVVGAGLGLAAGLLLLRLASTRLQGSPLMQPRVTAKVG